MSYGPDTELLLHLLERSRTTRVLDISKLNITELPPLPNNLLSLSCYKTPLTTLPPLPDTLEEIDCSFTRIRTLPKHLPQNLKYLTAVETPLTEYPLLPDTLLYLELKNYPNGFSLLDEEVITKDYILRWNTRIFKEMSLKRTQQIRCDLMAVAWHPDRVEKWLEADCLDMMLCI